VEKDLISNITTMKTCPQSYGICLAELFSETKHLGENLVQLELSQVALAVGQMKWLIKKGDVILSNTPREIVQAVDLEFIEATKKTGLIPIYSYPDEEHIPDRFDTAQNELTIVHSLEYDLAPIALSEFRQRVGVKKLTFYTATFKVKLILGVHTLKSELYLVSHQPGKADRLLTSKETEV